MEIALERRGDYSVRAFIDLARHYGNGRRKAREIASVMDIPVRYLPQLLAPMVHQGLLMATAGPEGGYEIARDPGSITVLEVIEAAEGPLESPRCVLRGGPCDWSETCPLHEAWGRARDALATELGRTTLAELAVADEAIQNRPARPRKPAHIEPVERRGVRDTPPPGRRSGGSARRQTAAT